MSQRGPVELAISKSFTAVEKQRLKAIGRAIDEAQRRTRAGKIDPKLLKEMGMTEQQLAQFVKKYSDKFEKIRKPEKKKDDKPALAEEDVVGNTIVETGSKKLQKGRSTEEGLADITGMSKLTPDKLRKLYESRKAKISPEYRKHVEAYLRAISESARRAEQ